MQEFFYLYMPFFTHKNERCRICPNNPPYIQLLSPEFPMLFFYSASLMPIFSDGMFSDGRGRSFRLSGKFAYESHGKMP